MDKGNETSKDLEQKEQGTEQIKSDEGKGFIKKIVSLFSIDNSEKDSIEKTPDPDILGNGMANDAAEKILNRKEQLAAIMKDLG